MAALQNEQYAYLHVWGNFDPTDITLRAGVIPSRTWRKGDVSPISKRAYEDSRWCLDSRLAKDRSLEEHILDVLAQIAANAALAALLREYAGEMQLVAYFRSHWPGLHFDKAISEGLGRNRLGVDFDFYHYYADPQGGSAT